MNGIIPTGFKALDKVIGGLPVGGICQITDHGMATGKTALALSIAANLIECGESVLYVSPEETITRRIASNFGIDSELFAICRTGDEGEIPRIALELSPSLVIIDSISSIGTAENWKYSSISAFCRVLVEMSPTSSFLFTNQERMHRFKQTHTGGRHLDKWLSISLSLSPLGFILKRVSPVGRFVLVEIKQFHPWVPETKIRMRMDFSSGFSRL
jgi:KaiC/GvpD/RAD55 family RecA-like ATPase